MERVDVARAFDYPYRRPVGSFGFDGDSGAVGPLARLDWAGRVPVLAIGSNAAPEQLARKFVPGGWGTIPVTTARLVGHDVVFAARLAAYGACPATLVRCAGVIAHVHVTWLTAWQLQHMDATEGLSAAPPVYRRVEMAAADVQLDPIPGLDGPPPSVWAYEATTGALRLDSTPWALAAIEADRRVWPERTQREVLMHLAGIFGVTDAEAVVRTAVRRPAARGEWNRLLSRHT